MSFFAMVWNCSDAEASAGAQELTERATGTLLGWRSVLDTAGVKVWIRAEGSGNVRPLRGKSGIVLGELFIRTGSFSSTPAPTEFDERESSALLESRGRLLLDTYWGRYVAVLHDSVGASTWILRDPTGGLPCFRRAYRGVEVYFCHIGDAVRVIQGPYTVDSDYVAASICQLGGLYVRQTGLDEVSRVLGGERIEHCRGRVTSEFLWDPQTIATVDIIEDPREAAERVYRSAQEVMHAWASCFETIAHALSGGLDSSIVLTLLRDAPAAPDLICFHYFSSAYDDDERVYARAMAREAGCRLVEKRRDPTEVNLAALSEAPLLTAPAHFLHFFEYGRYEANFALDHGAQAITCGAGGDQLFRAADPRLAARDYAVRYGLQPGLLRAARMAASRAQDSLWTVLWAAIIERVGGRRWEPRSEIGRYRSLVRPEVLEDVRRSHQFEHPLLANSDALPSGKRMHLKQLLIAYDLHCAFAAPGNAPVVAPLLSLPLWKTCLAIPTDVLQAEGQDRAMARRGFEQKLPREILIREWKGGPDAHLKQVFRRNRPWLRDMLLGGLVRKFLNETELERAIGGMPTAREVTIGEIADYLCTEVWLRQWTDRVVPVSAVNVGSKGLSTCKA